MIVNHSEGVDIMRGNSKRPKRKARQALPAYSGGDWGSYDRFLVARGTNLARFMHDMNNEMRKGWEKELEEMNRGKRGRPYIYPDSFMAMLVTFRQIMHSPLRILEGYMSFSMHPPDSSTMSRRFARMEYSIRRKVRRALSKARREGKRVMELSMDGTGISLSGISIWRETRYGKLRREFGKMVVAIDIETGQIVSWIAGRENFHEGVYSSINYLIEEAERYGKVERVYGDAAYANGKAIRDMIRRGIDPVIKVRKPTIRKALRDGIVDYIHLLAIQQSEWMEWVRRKKYGRRSSVEGIIGSFKRLFGESASSSKWFETEINARILLWNVMYSGHK